ncbi:MAG: aspartate--tRNA(Asn) ligase [Candidatus Diapherotrites archaeon]|nr:aspartate--tRNA(Asn) ligase [Candidatus Diapherotrites archaeon]
MERTLFSDCPKKAGQRVSVSGWVQENRDMGGLRFVILKDCSGLLQIVIVKKATSKEINDAVSGLTRESVVEIEGALKASEKAPNGVELIPEKFAVLGKAESPTPIDTGGKIESDLSKRLDHRFLDLRNEKSLAIFKVRSRIYKSCVDFFDSKGFTNINTPKITTGGAESGADLFPIVYFGREAFLSQSPQQYKQMMVCAGFEKVYEIAPVFRAENSNTPRHQTEFTGIDFEMGFIKHTSDVMDVIEELFKHVLTDLKNNCSKELALWKIELKIPKKIPRITMAEAKKLLKEKGKVLPENEDFDPEGERMVGEIAKEKFGEEFIFVTNYPIGKRPFYHYYNADGKTTDGFDMLWNGVEIATGGQREHRYEILKKQAKDKGIDLDSMGWYAELFRYGAPPHGGVGFGLDRIVQRLFKFENIREAVLLPRDPIRISP